MSTVTPTPAHGRPDRAGREPVTVIDVGGSHLRRARWTPGHEPYDLERSPSPGFRRHPTDSPAQLQARMVEALCASVPAGPGATAGVSFGAALDHRTGTVYASAPLWGDHAQPFDLLGALRARRPDVDWHVVNDVTAALLHFAAAPARRHHRKIMLMTISTGIACRTLDRRDDRIPVDGGGLQGETGHLPASATLLGEPVDLRCDCSGPRHLAAFSSGPGIQRMAEELRRRAGRAWDDSRLHAGIEAGASFETAFRGALDADDPLARDLLDAVTAPVADVLRTALCLDPDLDEVALTGGVAVDLAGHYRRAVLGHLTRQGLYLTSDFAPEWVERRITVCAPGEADGMIGAGLAALRAQEAA
ncbi:ROK family protein [Streptomyces triculaminicus]|uniref:ROK family protein n=1 Tax=Streptomyces triculaminicus TaxID=2816232 RepID=UPI0037D6B115